MPPTCALPAIKTGSQQLGHFVYDALAELPLAYAQQIGLTEPAVLMMGNGEHRSESIYRCALSICGTVDASEAMRSNFATAFRLSAFVSACR